MVHHAALAILIAGTSLVSFAQTSGSCVVTAIKAQTEPLTAHQKLCYFVKNRAVTPSGVFGSAFTAGIAQLTKSPKEWSQDAKGYGERFGTRFAQGLTKSTTESLVGILDHEDPRLRPSSEAGTLPFSASRILPRLGNAVIGTVWTTRDRYADGSARGPSFSYSRIAGSFASGFVGMAWTPDSGNTVGQAFGRTGTAFAGYVGTSIWTEFQPDIIRLVSKLVGQHKTKAGI